MGYLEICCLYFKYLVIFFRALSIFDLFNIIFAGKCALYELMFLTSRFKKNFRCKTFYLKGLCTLMEWGGRREEDSGWGTHVYLWRIHFDIWQN